MAAFRRSVDREPSSGGGSGPSVSATGTAGGGVGGKDGRPMWLFGAHHKTGTWLISRLAKFQGTAVREETCSISSVFGPCGGTGSFGPSCWDTPGFRNWFDCHMTSESLARVRKVSQNVANGNLRVVHIIRDPVAVVVSGYVYHTYSSDLRSYGLQYASLAEGVTREAETALTWSLPEMLGAYAESKKRGNVLTLHLEEFMVSSDDFDVAVERLYNFTLGDVLHEQALAELRQLARREDLLRHPWTDHSTTILRPDLKREAHAAMENIPQHLWAELLRYRKALGYA